MRWDLEEKYIESDPNLYYDGWLEKLGGNNNDNE